MSLSANLQPGKPPILSVQPADGAANWVGDHKDALREIVAQYGCVLVRGLGLRDVSDVSAVVQNLGAKAMIEKEAFASRKLLSAGVYSSSVWPQNQQMCMHHELSYALEFPGLMLFACLTPSTSGGATGVADAEAVLEALPKDLVRRFEEHGWMLTRSFNDEIGVSAAEAFGTEDRSGVEDYCRANKIDFEWQDDVLRTRQRRRAVVRHPQTGRRCWFNQIAFLNEWTIDSEVREFLVDMYGADGLPFNTRFGNGDAIGEDIVQTINAVYEAHTAREPWQAGDLMLVDNIRTAHSREPFEGDREILVSLLEPTRLAD